VSWGLAFEADRVAQPTSDISAFSPAGLIVPEIITIASMSVSRDRRRLFQFVTKLCQEVV
jgi:hypothetical protein